MKIHGMDNVSKRASLQNAEAERRKSYISFAFSVAAHMGALSLSLISPQATDSHYENRDEVDELHTSKRDEEKKPYSIEQVTSQIALVMLSDPNAFPEDEVKSIDFLYPSKKEKEVPKKDITYPNPKEEIYNPPEMADTTINQSPDVQSQLLTLETVRKERDEFRNILKKDMNDDAEGKMKLGSMKFIDFFIKSWFYDYAEKELEKGKQPSVKIKELYDSFESILNDAIKSIKPEYGRLQRIKMFHAAMISHLKGYEIDAGDIHSALIDGIINCDSGTMLGISGYSQLEPSVMINLLGADFFKGYKLMYRQRSTMKAT